MQTFERYLQVIGREFNWRRTACDPTRPFYGESLTSRQFLEIVNAAVEILDDHICVLCGVDTRAIDEMYMVKNELWKRYGCYRGMLCIGCFESRLGRELNADDFTKAPINTAPEETLWNRSPRLRARLNEGKS